MPVWWRWFEEEVKRHVLSNQGIYFFVVILFITGVVFGALTVRTLANHQKTELMEYLQVFVVDMTSETLPSGNELLLPALWANAKTIVLLWLGGLTVVGLPLTLILLFSKGFSSGFTAAFLIEEVKWRGFILAGTAMLPHSLLIIPALLFLTAGAISFAYCLLRQRFTKYPSQRNAPSLWSYGLLICYAGIAAFWLLWSTYITPVLAKITAAGLF